MPRSRLNAALVALAVTVCALALPGAALAAVSITDFSVTPSTTQAGAHPDVRISTGFALSPADDDVRDVTVRLPKGLLGNPNATPKCSSAAFVADTCPANTVVGSVQVTADVTVLATSTVVSNGTVYNLAPAGSEPARLGILVRPDPIGPATIQKIALIGVARIGPETGYALETVFANQPREAQSDIGPVPLAIRRIDLTLKGQPGATPFTVNPSSCGAATSTASADSYDAPTTASSRSSSFTPTGCAALPFAPKISGTVGAKGFNRKGAVAPLTTTFDFPAGGATLKDSVVKLPAGLAPGLEALRRACPATTPVASCPAASVVGSAKASSPLLTTALSGPVVLQSSSTGGLPKLVVRLLGAVPLTLEGATGQAGASLQNTFPGAPDVPLSRFELKLNGGKKGLLEAPYDLCRKTKPPTAAFALTGWNGKRVSQTVKLKVGGCAGYRPGKPHAAASLHGSSLRLRLTGAGDARLKKVTVTVPKGVRLRRVGARGNAHLKSLTLKGRRLTVTARGSGASTLTILGRKLVVRGSLRGHRAKLRLSAVDSYGRTSRTVTVRVR